MPMIVTQQRIPITADPAAMGSPVAISQMMKGIGPAAVLHFLSEGEKAERRKLEALKSYRNPYDGNAPEAAGQNPAKAADKPAHKEPEDVA